MNQYYYIYEFGGQYLGSHESEQIFISTHKDAKLVRKIKIGWIEESY